MMKLATGSAALVLALAAVYSAPASAVAEPHTFVSQAVARCGGALPAFETAIRKRPLAVQNEGTSNAFVTCSFEQELAAPGGSGTAGSYSLSTWYYNANAAATSLTCTAVTGYQTGTNEFIAQTVSIPPGEQAQLFWEDADFTGGMDSGLIAISCSLAPGIGINDTYINWSEDDA